MYELTKDNKLLSHDYTYFNSAILIAEQDTATKEKRKIKDGFIIQKLSYYHSSNAAITSCITSDKWIPQKTPP